jgi:DyP dimeric alpha+beta barrel domain
MAGLLRLCEEHRFVSADEIKRALSSPTFRTKCSELAMLAFDDIQHILLTRAPALTGRYEFLSFRSPAGGRAWLAAILDKVHSAQAMRASIGLDKRWVTVAFTWNGLRALGVPEQSLATFPEEFQQGMVARAQILGDTGANHPDNWVGGLASADLHAIVIPLRPRCG